MINTHHDSWQWITNLSEPEQHDQVMAQYDATWTQIADTFKDYPRELIVRVRQRGRASTRHAPATTETTSSWPS